MLLHPLQGVLSASEGSRASVLIPRACSSLGLQTSNSVSPVQAKGGQGGAWMLLHPLQELQPVAACARAQLRTSSPAQFQGEEVLWSSRLVPTLVTYNQVLESVSIHTELWVRFGCLWSLEGFSQI